MAFTKKNYVDLTGLSTFKSSLLGTVINDTNKATTSKTATIKAIADYVDSEVGDLSSAVTAELAKKVSSVTYDSTNKKLVYNKGGSTNTDIVTVATLKSAIGNFGKSGPNASAGLVPAPSTTAGSSKYLREDGSWVTPPNTTYSVFGKSGSGASIGLVPKPSTTAGSSKYLREDGTWATPPDTNTTYTNATTSQAGLMGADDKAKLDGIATNANNYSHPTYTSKDSGFYKITVDGTGHVSATTAVAKADITALGIPGSDTTYSVFGKSGSGAKSGLVPAPSTTAGTSKYLREDGTWTTPPDTNTTYTNATTSKAGLMGADDKTKLNGIATGAEVNQNAFSNVTIGDVTVSADSKTDTLTLVAGSNVTITPDATNDKITISSSYVNTTYSAGTDLGLSGTTFNHANSGVTAGTYRSVTVNARGHVTGGTNPTTLSGYGITDAKISNGVITLGSNTITPLTSSSSLNASKLTGTISVDRLPATALERCVVVADDTARFALTTSNVQVGDTVKVTSTKKMYMVVDSSKLSTEAGYEEYFTSTDWSTITNKPTSYYTHPSYTAKSSGLYKITVDALGHVSGATAVAKADITALGIPSSDTTYSIATSSTPGLVKSQTTGTTSNRDYGVEVSSTDGTMKVNVPWTDKKVTSEANNTTKAYLVGSTDPSTNTGTLIKDANVYLDTTAGKLVATTFSGALSGNADTATKLGTSNVGGTTTPIYLSGGTPTALSYTIEKSVPSNAVFTDTKVTQNAVTDSDYTNFRPLIFGSSNSGTAGFTPSTVTDGVYACKGLYVRPSAGLIHATTFEGTLSDVNKVKVAGKVTLQYNSSTESLDFVFA